MPIDKELNQAIIYHKKMASIYKRNHNDSEGNAELKLVGWLEELKRLRAQEPCEDAVSREMIMRHYDSGEYKHVNHISRNGLLDYIEQLPSVTPKLAECDDAVSRNAAIDAVKMAIIRSEQEYAVEALEKIPPVTPQRTGKWKMISPAGVYECSKCGKNVLTKDIDCYKFCHGCGCEMRGVKND